SARHFALSYDRGRASVSASYLLCAPLLQVGACSRGERPGNSLGSFTREFLRGLIVEYTGASGIE
ncbi:MAG: hypothetical protein ACE5D3_07895, partial [Candidatus Binatia bacterium]